MKYLLYQYFPFIALNNIKIENDELESIHINNLLYH